MIRLSVVVGACLAVSGSLAQGVIRGKVMDAVSREPIPFATVQLQGTDRGTTASETGAYELTNIPPGLYNVQASFVGYSLQVVFEVQVTASRPALVDFFMQEETVNLDEITVEASSFFVKTDESPLSLRSIGTTEIKRTPGGNRDISRVVRSLPGVASTPSFRNDIIIRGGSPSENTFYLDGIQIPAINHFQTQGSSGGPVGIINVDLLNEVNFYSGAFPANRGNTMSSVFDFKLKDGRDDQWIVNGIVGATDLGITLDGPVTRNSTLVFSVRRSYLQFLFDLFNLPFLPVYNDAQFKYKYNINDKNQITLLGIGAIDNFSLNEDAPDQIDDPAEREEAEYILNALPVSEQWNYTLGIRYDHFRKNGNTTVVLSHNQLHNTAIKYRNNDDSNPANLIQDYDSRESEWRVRLEDYAVKGKWKLNYGVNYEAGRITTSDFNQIVTGDGLTVRDFYTDLQVNKFGAFGQVSSAFLKDRLSLSAGLRLDMNDYSEAMRNPLDQFSPRVAASYAVTEKISLNFNTGIYYQLPAYTVLAYRNSTTNELENKQNGVKYIRSAQVVGGVEVNLKSNSRITVEGFYKNYSQYPFLLEDSVSLANLGADFGVIGNAPVNATSEGRSYGVEFLLQQKLFKGFYGLLAYTWVTSEFANPTQVFVPSSWDNRHLVSLTGGKKFGKNWEIGARWIFTGGSPFTPFDVNATVKIENWNVRPFGVPDYNRLNTDRISAFHQLDLRIDKKYYFRSWSLNAYVDVQNVYNHQTQFQDNIDVVKDANGIPIEDSSNPGFYIPRFIQNTSGQVLPTIGIIVEF